MGYGSTPTFDEALRLTLAYYCILEPEKRAILHDLAEKYADPSRQKEAPDVDFDPVLEEGRPATAIGGIKDQTLFGHLQAKAFDSRPILTT